MTQLYRSTPFNFAVSLSAARVNGKIHCVFGKFGDNVPAVKPDNIAGAVAASWL